MYEMNICRTKLDELLAQPEVSDKLQSSGQGFREAVKFYLPKLLLGPVFHCFHYFKYIGKLDIEPRLIDQHKYFEDLLIKYFFADLLTKLTPFTEDRDSLEQVAAMLSPLQGKLTAACTSSQILGNFLSGKPVRKQSEVFHRSVLSTFIL